MKNTHKKYAQKPRTELRRKEFQVTEEKWMRKLLNQGAYGTLATVHNHQPFITPVLFLFEEETNALFFHGAHTGRLRANIEINPNVAFSVVKFGNILAHKNASDFNVEYQSVVVFGKVYPILDDENVSRALYKFLKKYAPQLEPGKDFNLIQSNELKKTAVFCIEIEEWSGKQQVETSDYLDIFKYPQPE